MFYFLYFKHFYHQIQVAPYSQQQARQLYTSPLLTLCVNKNVKKDTTAGSRKGLKCKENYGMESKGLPTIKSHCWPSIYFSLFMAKEAVWQIKSAPEFRAGGSQTLAHNTELECEEIPLKLSVFGKICNKVSSFITQADM